MDTKESGGSEYFTSKREVKEPREGKDYAVWVKEWPTDLRSNLASILDKCGQSVEGIKKRRVPLHRFAEISKEADWWYQYDFDLLDKSKYKEALKEGDEPGEAMLLLDLVRNASPEENKFIMNVLQLLREYKESDEFYQLEKQWEDECREVGEDFEYFDNDAWLDKREEGLLGKLKDIFLDGGTESDWYCSLTDLDSKRREATNKEERDEKARIRMLRGCLEGLSGVTNVNTGIYPEHFLASKDAFGNHVPDYVARDVRYYRAEEIIKHPVNLEKLRQILD